MDDMNDREVSQRLLELLGGDDDPLPVRSLRTFEEAAMLTSDVGFVVTLANGQRFAVTIQETRRGLTNG